MAKMTVIWKHIVCSYENGVKKLVKRSERETATGRRESH